MWVLGPLGVPITNIELCIALRFSRSDLRLVRVSFRELAVKAGGSRYPEELSAGHFAVGHPPMKALRGL